MTSPEAFVCSLEPTLERFSLTYEGRSGESAGSASIIGGTTAVAQTTWGKFHLVPYEMGDMLMGNS